MIYRKKCLICKDPFTTLVIIKKYCCAPCAAIARSDRRSIGTTKKACLQCGGIGDFRRHQRFCCHSCGHNYNRRGKKSYCGYGECKRCGVRFHKRTFRSTYCSSECNTKKVSVLCIMCGVSFLTSRAAKVCSKKCSKFFLRQRKGQTGLGENRVRMDF